MKNNMWKKGLVLGIILLFVGASVIPSVLGNNSSRMDHILEERIQTNPSNEGDYLILWAGNATVWWEWNYRCSADANHTLTEEFTHNLSEPSTLYIIVILNTTLDLKRNFGIRRGGFYEFEVTIDGKEATYDTNTIHNSNPDKYQESWAIIIPVKIENNETLSINIQVGATPIFGRILPILWQSDYDVQNVIVHVQLP
ncbi:hypothetical protein MBGDF03_00582 [Thermoplasmatales archaeon SCGC AB-540-F20]|nr:hypothetical protein MBGDF03_00582 [Thermoplasmatales archaeon SCGC AB-540-F20]